MATTPSTAPTGRPTLRGYGVSDWMTVILFGIAHACMNALFYEALARVPLGATVTIGVLGPLVLSAIVSRRAASWLWAVLAFAGVALLGQGSFEQLDPVGVAFAFGAAVAIALVIGASIGAVRTASRTARGRSMPQA